MRDQRLFVQFIHPGGEHNPNGSKTMPWNSGLHRRKFLVTEGRYLDAANQPRDGNVAFWGEWEPQSHIVHEYRVGVPDGPRWSHQPFYDLRGATGRPPRQNTDPFVFGDRFHYTGCLQATKRGPTQLRYLDRGSIILFGSCLGLSRFVVDTIFVVDRWMDHSARDHERPELRREVAKAFGDVVLDRWYAGCSASEHRFRLYFGATPDNPVDGTFSFFPCLPEAEASRGFARPTIQIDRRITATLKQGKKLTLLDSGAVANAVWREVVDQVRAQGLRLGVRAELPPRVS